MHTYTQQLPVVNAPTLQSSSMILRLHISMYTGRKADKKTQQEVLTGKGARSKGAASVYKSLFAGDQDLDSITAFASHARRRVSAMTVPWGDNGDRLLATKSFFDVSAELSSLRVEFEARVKLFSHNYGNKIGNAAFALGDLFDRNEYPHPDEITHKFAFGYSFEPLPDSGDFRVDLHNDALDMLRASYQKASDQRLEAAMQDVWSRVIDETTRLRDKMIVPEQGNRPRIFETTLDGFKELIGSLDALNITNDPQLETIRTQLHNALDPVDIDSLRESDSVRGAVKEQMQRVLDKFSI